MRGTTLEQRREAIRRVAECVVDSARTERLRPRALEEIARHDAAARAIFDGLLLHYIEGACKGRLELWAKAGQWPKYAKTTGTVIRHANGGTAPLVLWDGRKTGTSYYPGYIRRIHQ